MVAAATPRLARGGRAADGGIRQRIPLNEDGSTLLLIMTLLQALGLPNPKLVARPAPGAGGVPMQLKGGMGGMGGTAQGAQDDETDDGMGEQVRLDGQTAAMLRARASKARAIADQARSDLETRYKGYHRLEATLVPLAKTIEEAMKVPPKQIAAEIHKATQNKDLRRLGTDADQAKELLEDVADAQRLVKTLVGDANMQVDIANDAIRANKTVNDAAELKEKVAALKEGLENLLKMTEIVLAPEEATLKVISMVGNWTIGASSLKARSDELQEMAKKETEEVLQKSLARACRLGADLSPQVADLKRKILHRVGNAERLAHEAEHSFDSINKANGGKFRFEGFTLAVKAAQGSLDLLAQAASQRRDAIRQVVAIDHWLHSHHEERKQHGGMKEQGDPMKVGGAKKALQQQMDAVLAEVKKCVGEVSEPMEGVDIDVAMASRRLARWTDFYLKTQEAMFEAPAPD